MGENVANIPVETKVEQDGSKEIKMMEQRLNGVMFHVFYTDLFELLNLEGFKKFHKKQKREEEASLNKLKTNYIRTHKKLPMLNPDNSANYWEKYKYLNMDSLTQQEICEIVKDSINMHYKWEKQALKNYIAWDEMDVAKEVMKEVNTIEYISQLLNEYNYEYENVIYVSNKL